MPSPDREHGYAAQAGRRTHEAGTDHGRDCLDISAGAVREINNGQTTEDRCTCLSGSLDGPPSQDRESRGRVPSLVVRCPQELHVFCTLGMLPIVNETLDAVWEIRAGRQCRDWLDAAASCNSLFLHALLGCTRSHSSGSDAGCAMQQISVSPPSH